MVAVHLGPTGLGDVAGRLSTLPHGRASILFVLVAGVRLDLLTPDAATDRDAGLLLRRAPQDGFEA